MKRIVICHNEIDGLHQWATQPQTAPHGYLKNAHRHTFVIETKFEVTEDDRQIEFFARQDEIEQFVRDRFGIAGELVNFRDASCEMIAKAIAERFDALSCEVREDGKGGAIYVR